MKNNKYSLYLNIVEIAVKQSLNCLAAFVGGLLFGILVGYVYFQVDYLNNNLITIQLEQTQTK